MKNVAVRHFPAIVLRLCLVVLIAFACSGHPAIATAQRNPATSNSLSTPLTISPVEQKEWYEKGNWPLFGSVLTVLITNLIAVSVVYLTANRTLQGLLKQKKLERVTASLNEFYNPLKALLEANRVIFSKTGPRSWPTEHIEREAAALVWTETKLKILENNKAIELILQTKTHLIDESDSLEKYADMLVHVTMYEAFQKVGTDLYAKFQLHCRGLIEKPRFPTKNANKRFRRLSSRYVVDRARKESGGMSKAKSPIAAEEKWCCR